MLKKMTYLFIFISGLQISLAHDNLEILPDIGIGPIQFSMNLNTIKSLGFQPIVDAHKTSILQKEDLIVILENEKVKAISYIGKDTSKLIFKSKVLPKQNNPTALKNFFKNCSSEIKGSSGITTPCEDGKIEIIHNYLNKKLDLEFDSISLKKKGP